MEFGWIEAGLAVGIAFVVPTGFLSLQRIHGDSRRVPKWAKISVLSLITPWPFVSALLAVPWCGFAIREAVAGLRRWMSNRSARAFAEAVPAGFLAVGGVFLVLGRGDVSFLGFSNQIVDLTAVHFHFAGFVLPLIALLNDRVESSSISRAALWGTVLATPLTAAGIVAGAAIELVGAFLVASSAVTIAVIQLRIAWRSHALLMLASAALLVSMPLAAIYAYGEFTVTPYLTIPMMLRTHGALNAFGFALPAVYGWNKMGLA